MDKETIKSILLAHGYTIKPGCDDLRDYVHKAAFELLELAAPAVQGEPVSLRQRLFNGWEGCSNHGCVVVDPKPGMMRTNGSCQCVVNASRSQLYMLQGRIQSVLSATQQPVEQQPMRAADRQENVSGGWRSRFLRLMGEMQSELDDSNEDPIPSELWSLWRELLDTAPQPAEQRPAPDVAGLMGVLGQYFDAMDSIGREGTATSTLIAEAKCDEAEARLRLFLAAHRKQGGGQA